MNLQSNRGGSRSATRFPQHTSSSGSLYGACAAAAATNQEALIATTKRQTVIIAFTAAECDAADTEIAVASGVDPPCAPLTLASSSGFSLCALLSVFVADADWSNALVIIVVRLLRWYKATTPMAIVAEFMKFVRHRCVVYMRRWLYRFFHFDLTSYGLFQKDTSENRLPVDLPRGNISRKVFLLDTGHNQSRQWVAHFPLTHWNNDPLTHYPLCITHDSCHDDIKIQ